MRLPFSLLLGLLTCTGAFAQTPGAESLALRKWTAETPSLTQALQKNLRDRGLPDIILAEPQLGIEEGQVRIDLLNHDLRYHSAFLVPIHLSEPEIQERISRLADIAADDFLEKTERRAELESRVSVSEPSPLQGSRGPMVEAAPEAGARLGVGDMPIFNLWTELPGISAGENRQWLRTRIAVDGALSRSNQELRDAILVTRLSTTVFSIQFNHEGTLAGAPLYTATRFDLGTLDAAIRWDGVATTGRIDVNPLQITHSGLLQIHRDIALYYEMSVRVGMRVFEEALPTVRAVLGGSARVGLLFNNQFFIEASTQAATDFHEQRWMTFTGAIGWKLSDSVTLLAGLTHSPAIDRMFAGTGGWCFFIGITIIF